MSSPFTAPSAPPSPAIARKRRMMTIAISALVGSAVFVLVLPIPLPWPLRFVVAGIDLIAAAVIFVALRQQVRR